MKLLRLHCVEKRVLKKVLEVKLCHVVVFELLKAI